MEEFTKYNAKIKTYPNGTQKITLFNKPIYNPHKLKDISDLKREQHRRWTMEEKARRDFDEIIETEERSDNLKRSKDKIFDIAYANSGLWSHMVTFTLDPKKIDRYDSKEVNIKIKKWLQNQSQRRGCNYLLIPERHKDGAIHFHGLICGNFTFLDSGHKDKSGRTVYHLSDFPYGFTTAVELDNDTQLFVCKYITKYITKSTDKIMGKRYYAGGKSLNRDLPCEYALMDFEGNFSDCVSCEVPNTDMKVKYITLGVL